MERNGYDGFRDAVDLDLQDTGSLSGLRSPVAEGSQLSSWRPPVYHAAEAREQIRVGQGKAHGGGHPELRQEVYRFAA
jgi:hypothetical protein